MGFASPPEPAVGTLPYLATSSLIGVLAVVALRLLRRGPVRSLFVPPRRVAIAGFFGIAVYTLLLTAALALADEKDLGQVLLLNYLWPTWIILLSLILLPTPSGVSWAIVGAGIGFAGVVLSRDPLALATVPANYLPHVMAFIASFLWAAYSVLLRRWRIASEQAGATLQFLLCAILATILNVIGGSWPTLGSLDPAAVALILIGGIGPVGLAYHAWEIAVKRGNVHIIALLSYFIPVVSVLLVGLAYRQAMTLWLLPAGALIAVGAYVGHRSGPGQ